MEFMEPMQVSPEGRRLELIAEVIKLYDKHLSYNSAAWKDCVTVVINALAGKKPDCYGNARQLACYQILKKHNPTLLGQVAAYVNSYGKVMF